MKRFNFPIALLFVAALCTFTSCEDDEEPIIPNEEELITTVNYTLTPASGGDAVVMSFVDLDGDGGNAATLTGGTLQANTTYNGSLDLLNEAESPAESITAEIEDEALEHQFFFESSVAGLSVAYADQDSNGNPIGLSTTVTTGEAGSGNLKVTLKHEPVKSADGVSTGDITNSAGEIDIEVTFPVDVE